MKKEKRDRSRILWLCVVVLFVLVAVTTLGYSLVLNTYLPDDSGAIPHIPETVTPAPDGGEKKPEAPKAPESAPEPEAPAENGHGAQHKKTDPEHRCISFTKTGKLQEKCKLSTFTVKFSQLRVDRTGNLW